MPPTDGGALLVGAGLVILLIVSVIVSVIPSVLLWGWVRGRHVRLELSGNTGVTKDEPVRLFTAGDPENPTMAQYLELRYPGRIRDVMMVYRVGAAVTFTDGTVQLFGYNGKPLSDRYGPMAPDGRRRSR